MKTVTPKEPKPSESFENFERFAKKLMAVPKKEIDKELAKYERKKTAKKRAIG